MQKPDIIKSQAPHGLETIYLPAAQTPARGVAVSSTIPIRCKAARTPTKSFKPPLKPYLSSVSLLPAQPARRGHSEGVHDYGRGETHRLHRRHRLRTRNIPKPNSSHWRASPFGGYVATFAAQEREPVYCCSSARQYQPHRPPRACLRPRCIENPDDSWRGGRSR